MTARVKANAVIHAAIKAAKIITVKTGAVMIVRALKVIEVTKAAKIIIAKMEAVMIGRALKAVEVTKAAKIITAKMGGVMIGRGAMIAVPIDPAVKERAVKDHAEISPAIRETMIEAIKTVIISAAILQVSKAAMALRNAAQAAMIIRVAAIHRAGKARAKGGRVISQNSSASRALILAQINRVITPNRVPLKTG